MGLQAKLAAFGGDLWRSWRMLALWPWPAVLLGERRPLMDAEDYRRLTRKLRPGDFILTRSEPYFISNHFIGRNGTAFAHLAVYTGPVAGIASRDVGTIQMPRPLSVEDDALTAGKFKRSVTHAVSEGVICQDFLELFRHADWMAVVRPCQTLVQAQEIRETALRQVGLQYNFDFTPEGPKALYCTELGVLCCERAGIHPPEQTEIPVSLFGKRGLATLADAFVTRFPVVACSASCADPRFARRSRFEGLREALARRISA